MATCLISAASSTFGQSGGHTIIYETESGLEVEEFLGCESPRIEHVATVLLDNRTIIVEVTFNSNYPSPSANSFPRNQVTLNGGKFPITKTPESDGRYVFVITENFATSIQFRFWDNCVDDEITEEAINPTCGSGSGLLVSDRFQSDWLAFLGVANQQTPIHTWLNGLTYLTKAQRWSFFQEVYGNCTPVTTWQYQEFISDIYAMSSATCSCSAVRIRRYITPGDIPRRGPAEANAPFSFNEVRFGPTRGSYRFDYGAGPAKHTGSHVYGDNTGSFGSNELYYERSIGGESGSIRTLRTSIVLACRDGEALPASCGCSRKVKVNYAYEAQLRTEVDAKATLFGKSEAQATVDDWAVVSFQEDTGPETAAGVSIMSLASSCEKSINPDFVNKFATFIGSLVNLNLKSTDSTIMSQQGQRIATSVGNLGSLITTSPIVGDACENRIVYNSIPDGAFTLELEPNIPHYVYVRSADRLVTSGKKRYEALAESSSGYRLSFFLAPTDDADTPEWCCSDFMGAYITDSYISDESEQSLRDVVEFYMDSRGLTLDANMDAGSASRRSSNPFCMVRIDALKLGDKVVASRTLFDIHGRVVKQLESWDYVDQMGLADGVYFLANRNKYDVLIGTDKVVVNGSRVMRTSAHSLH